MFYFFLPVFKVAMGVKKMCKNYHRVFGCHTNPHSQIFSFLNYIWENYNFLKFRSNLLLKFVATNNIYCESREESNNVPGEEQVLVLVSDIFITFKSAFLYPPTDMRKQISTSSISISISISTNALETPLLNDTRTDIYFCYGLWWIQPVSPIPQALCSVRDGHGDRGTWLKRQHFYPVLERCPFRTSARKPTNLTWNFSWLPSNPSRQISIQRQKLGHKSCSHPFQIHYSLNHLIIGH
jgi:hypothetical protein